MRQLVVRADTSSQIGTGHVMRGLALAQAWQDGGGNATFALATRAPALEARLQSEGMPVAHLASPPGSDDDASETAELARHAGASWVVVDGYHFGVEYQRALKQAGMQVLFVDDYGHAGRYCADFVLNQNIHADAALYSNRDAGTRLLLGTRYALLRREFGRWRNERRVVAAEAHKVLVTLGGADPDNVTRTVVRALQELEGDAVQARVLVGFSNPHADAIGEEILVRRSESFIQLVCNANNMPELMAWADVAVAAGGSTCWELAFMGLPSVLVVVADNQAGIAEGLAAAGAAISLGRREKVSQQQVACSVRGLLGSYEQRKRLSETSRGLVDGKGAGRVLSAMHSLAIENGKACA